MKKASEVIASLSAAREKYRDLEILDIRIPCLGENAKSQQNCSQMLEHKGFR